MMNKVLWLMLSLVCNQSYAYTFELYKNERFNYQIAYPTFLIPQGESENSDGQIIKSEAARLIVWGDYMPKKIDDAYQGAKSNLKDYEITYEVKKPTYFIMCAISKDEVAYFKTVFVCDKNINFQFFYPRNEKKSWDPIATEISKSFKYADKNCRSTEQVSISKI